MNLLIRKTNTKYIRNQILKNHHKESIEVKSLMKNTNNPSKNASTILLKLEEGAKIYIDRIPKISENTELREDLKDNDMIYFDCFPSIKRKSLLYKTKVEYGNYTINHILGCSHGCSFPCYAKMMALRYGKIKNNEQWLHPKIVENALELLDKEIPKYKCKIDFVHLSFTTDPFMYDALNERNYPEIQKLTLDIIQKLNDNGIKVTTLTKGLYPVELVNGYFNKNNEYGISLVSLDADFKEKYETYSSPYQKRIESLKNLKDAGLKTWVSIEPYPTPNIIDQDINEIVNSIRFVDKIIFGKWNYNSKIKSYKEYKKFYEQNAQFIIQFCKERGIDYHIKEGTPCSLAETNGIFHNKN